MKKPKLKRLVSGVVSTVLALNTLSVLPAFAAEDDAVSPYPYTIFAGSSEDGAITTTAYNFSVNGNVGTNGTIVSTGNMNINGQRKEHLSEDMPVLFDDINAAFFSENVDGHDDDYTYSDTNISVSVPLDVNGELDLNGNITITTGVKALDDIDLSGEVQNTSDSVICSQNGDITIDSTNVSLTGLIYAPYGTVDITAQNLNLNSVVIIADKVRIDAPNVNANNSAAIAEFVGRAMGNTNTGSDDESSSLTDSSSETDSSSQDDSSSYIDSSSDVDSSSDIDSSSDTDSSSETDSSSDTEPETHEEETPEFTPAIYAFGNVSKDNTEIEINWYSNIKGDYVIYESNDNENYESTAIISDEESYTYPITDNFDKKYFKVSVNSLEQSAVSMPFIVKRTSSGYISELLDTDEDKLADLYEQMLGTDINDNDTDDDTLTDYEEVYITGTDPLVYDSDTAGISDADADSDEDRLSNRQEITLGTNPQKADTDGDTLSDGDEVNVYHTDPLVPDTDGDRLDDGDEVMFGEDPLDEDSDDNGIPDGQEKRTQTFTHEVENKDCAVTEVTVTMDASGNINNTTEIESIMDKDYMCSRVVGLVGEPLSIETTSEFTEATLTFKVDQTKLGDTEFDNLMFLWYDEENDNFVELETEHDADASSVSIITDHFSKYMLVDSKTWFEAWAEVSRKIESYMNNTSIDLPTVTGMIVYGSDDNDPIAYHVLADEDGSQYTVYARCRDIIKDYIIDNMSDGDLMSYSYHYDFSPNGSYALASTNPTDYKIWLKNWDEPILSVRDDIGFDVGVLTRDMVKKAPDNNYRVVVITDRDLTITDQKYYRFVDQYGIQFHFFCIGEFDHPNIDAIKGRCNGGVYDFESDDRLLLVTHAFIDTIQKVFKNSDKDKFTDYEETHGLICDSGCNPIFTNPYKEDTDGDNLNDDVEIDPNLIDELVFDSEKHQAVHKLYYHYNSDPNNENTDGDGLDDNLDNEPTNPEKHSFLIYDSINPDDEDKDPRNTIDLQQQKQFANNDLDNRAEDFCYANMTKEDICKLNLKMIIDDIDSSQVGYHLSKWHQITEWGCIFGTDTIKRIAFEMIDHFMDGTGSDYTNDALNRIIENHDNTVYFASAIEDAFIKVLLENDWEIDKLRYDPQKRDYSEMVKYMKMQQKDYDVDCFYLPKYKEYTTGLGITVDSISQCKIELTYFKQDNYAFVAELKYTFYDVYGLDSHDIDTYGWFPGFNNWFILQHWDEYNGKYQPFLTCIEFEHMIKDRK